MTNYYIKNLETGKYEFYFDYSYYKALPAEDQKSIKNNCLFSRNKSAWITKGKFLNWTLETLIKKLQIEYKGEEGEKISFAEQIERQQEKATNRAEYMESKAEKFENESTKAYEQAKKISSFIPMGQPILIGHHSEGRHRRDINKIDNAMRKSCELSDKAKYYENRAEAAERTAKGNFDNPVYVDNRIKETETTLRKLERYLQGKTYTYSEPREISEKSKEFYLKRLEEETEKLNFYKQKQIESGVYCETITQKQDFERRKITHIKRRGTWYPVKSFNTKSITILNWISAGATWVTSYAEVQETATAEDNKIVYDRDGKEVKPQVKFKETAREKHNKNIDKYDHLTEIAQDEPINELTQEIKELEKEIHSYERQPEVKTYDNLKDIENAANSGQMISICNLYDLVNKPVQQQLNF